MGSNNSVIHNLSDKKISSLFWQYALPAIIGISINTLSNIINGVFIGYWVGNSALSASGLVLPIMNLTIAFGVLVGIGAASRLSICLGSKDNERAQKIVGATGVLSLLLNGLTIVCLLYFMRPILEMAGASDATYPYARDFLVVFLPGSIITSLALGYNNLMRASGYPLKAMITMFISVIANIILAPIFILWFDWGMKGAALATTLSMTISFVFVMLHFTDKKRELRLSWKNLRLDVGTVKSIVSIGMAPFFIQVGASVIVMLINNQLKHYAPVAGITIDDAIAGYANTNRLLTFVVMVVIGVNQGMQPIIGYNYGAKNYDRVRQTLWYAVAVATCFTTAGFVLGVFFPAFFVRMFTPDPEIIRVSAFILRNMSLAFVLVGFQMAVSGFFQCIGMARVSIFLSLTRQVIILIPALLILPVYLGLDGVVYAVPVADVLATLLTGYIFYRQLIVLRLEHAKVQSRNFVH